MALRSVPGPDPAGRARFAGSVGLTKAEVFTACQALADADRLLARVGGTSEAGALGDLFELLEERLSRTVGPACDQSPSGRYSSEREFTQ